MKVIALEGCPNCGKTKTLNIVYYLLLQAGYTQVKNAFIDFKDDCFDVLEIPGKRIGIITQGDYAIGQYSVKNHLANLQSYDCDVAICACTIGASKQKIKDAITAYPSHNFVFKSKSNSVGLERIDNFNNATHIMSLI